MACVLILRPSVVSTYRARRSLLLCFTAAHFFWNAGSSACFNKPWTIRQSASDGMKPTEHANLELVQVLEEVSLGYLQRLADQLAEAGVALVEPPTRGDYQR